MKNIRWFVIGVSLFSAILASASYAGPEKYGQAIVNRQVTAIKDILADPKAYEGKTVTIEGKIDNECQTGCWFYIKVAKGNSVIYVDLEPGGFAIPQKTNRKVLVEGKVVIKKTGPMIHGKGVEIQ